MRFRCVLLSTIVHSLLYGFCFISIKWDLRNEIIIIIIIKYIIIIIIKSITNTNNPLYQTNYFQYFNNSNFKILLHSNRTAVSSPNQMWVWMTSSRSTAKLSQNLMWAKNWWRRCCIQNQWRKMAWKWRRIHLGASLGRMLRMYV